MVASFLGSQHTFCFLQVATNIQTLIIHPGNDNHEEEDEKDADDDDDHPLPQLRAEEDSARKIGGTDADDGGRGDKEGLNLKVLMKQNHFKSHFYQKSLWSHETSTISKLVWKR